MEHLVKVGTAAKVLEELRVASKPAKVKGRAGRRKQKAAAEDLDDEGAEAEEQPGAGPALDACGRGQRASHPWQAAREPAHVRGRAVERSGEVHREDAHDRHHCVADEGPAHCTRVM